MGLDTTGDTTSGNILVKYSPPNNCIICEEYRKYWPILAALPSLSPAYVTPRLNWTLNSTQREPLRRDKPVTVEQKDHNAVFIFICPPTVRDLQSDGGTEKRICRHPNCHTLIIILNDLLPTAMGHWFEDIQVIIKCCFLNMQSWSNKWRQGTNENLNKTLSLCFIPWFTGVRCALKFLIIKQLMSAILCKRSGRPRCMPPFLKSLFFLVIILVSKIMATAENIKVTSMFLTQ